jgi:hypothetical protein
MTKRNSTFAIGGVMMYFSFVVNGSAVLRMNFYTFKSASTQSPKTLSATLTDIINSITLKK